MAARCVFLVVGCLVCVAFFFVGSYVLFAACCSLRVVVCLLLLGVVC